MKAKVLIAIAGSRGAQKRDPGLRETPIWPGKACAGILPRCTGSDAVKTANRGDKTVVLLSDFYRQGDGNIESFTAKMIVSDSIDPVAPGGDH